MLDTNVIQVTGRGTNVNFVIDDSAPIEKVAQGLHDHLTEHRALYSRGTITVNVGRRILEREELTKIKQILEKESGVTVSRFWCAPSVLEEALSESIGFGVAVSPAEAPQRDDAEHSKPKESRKSALRDEDEAAGLEKWAAYVLEETPPLTKQPSRPVTRATEAKAPPTEETAETTEVEASFTEDIIETSAAKESSAQEAVEAQLPEQPAEEVLQETRDTEQQTETGVASTVPELEREPETQAEEPTIKESIREAAALPQVARVSRIDPKQEMVGLNRGNEALLIKTTCRSGEVIRYPGDVVVLADVNPGAEIIADGDILVFGSLRGLAHAGASGDIQATIIALNLDTHRLQIGPYTGVAPKSNKRSKSNTSNPRIALVRRRAIYVAPYVGRFAGYSGGTLYDG